MSPRKLRKTRVSKKKVVNKVVDKKPVISALEAHQPQADLEQDLINRMTNCEAVVRELETSNVWKIVQADMERQRQMLDNNWQEIAEPEKLQKARELKMATMHILMLKDKYQEELIHCSNELDKIRNKTTKVRKDYDPE